MRTTSQVESLNSSIQRSFPSTPNIFSFILNLQLFDSIKSTDLYQLHLGSITNPQLGKRRLEDQERDEKIKLCTDNLKKGEISVQEILMLMADQNIKISSDGMHIYLSLIYKIFFS